MGRTKKIAVADLPRPLRWRGDRGARKPVESTHMAQKHYGSLGKSHSFGVVSSSNFRAISGVMVGKLFFAMALLLTLSSCERWLMEKDPANDPLTNFESMWTTIDRKYTFFELKNIDWDAVYTTYRARISDDMTTRELYEVLADMLFELRDGHVNLITAFDISRNWRWYLDGPQNFNYTIVERYYLEPHYEITGPLYNTWLPDTIGYVYYGSFSRGVSDFHIDYVIAKYSKAKGLIIDVRNNGGGNTANVSQIVSRFISDRTLMVREQYKTGPGHNDFTEPFDRYLEPNSDSAYTKPVVVLTNRSSYSATNDFVAHIRNIPNVTLVGDTTGGGGGYPYYAELPNGWRYRFSSTATITPDGLNIETGIPPDVRVNMLPLDEINKRDNIIEAAINLLK